MDILEYIKSNILIMDGGFGTELQKLGLKPGTGTEEWNLTHPEEVKNVHLSYFNAGSNMVSTNTFGVNGFKYSEDEINRIVHAAYNAADMARKETGSGKEKFIALDIGPSGRMLRPFGDMDFEEAVGSFAKIVRAGAAAGCDCILIETFTDCYETKAAVLAAKENSSLPVFVSNAYSSNGKLLSGTSPECMAVMLKGLGADAVGCNCSLGPRQLFDVVKRLRKSTDLPVIFKPNAGMPKQLKGSVFYDCSSKMFASGVNEAVKLGASLVGGCCGTDPSYIKETADILRSAVKTDYIFSPAPVCCSSKNLLDFSGKAIIGERLNPTGKKRLKEAILSSDISYMLGEGLSQEKAGAHALDVNMGLPGINEREVLSSVVTELQAVTGLPLCIDSSDVSALEKSLRLYNGKAVINSVNGKKESMESVFPLAVKYGGLVIALTLDESGVPAKACDRVNIAHKIYNEALKYGLNKTDLLFDCLTMSVSADPQAAMETLKAVEMLHEEGFYTVLGVSNVSYGLPSRDTLSSAFYLLALRTGLNGAIMNPCSRIMMDVYRSFMALSGHDEGFKDYIGSAAGDNSTPVYTSVNTLHDCITGGLSKEASVRAGELLKEKEGLDIINSMVIPALDCVGKKYETGEIYLPQLLMAAEAANSAFSEIKKSFRKTDAVGETFVIATVKGDIHDIGKNIVKLLLESYGFKVVDLGKDVEPGLIVKAVLKEKSRLLGLSALMTTTLPAMEETVKLVKKASPGTRIIVGGAVLTKEYAEKIGAVYASDGMQTVKIALEK